MEFKVISKHLHATAVIADDEPALRHHLHQALTEIWPELEVVAKVEDGRQALAAIQQWQPEVIFLDIRMPELDGLQVAQQLSAMDKIPWLVFITAYDQYAVTAFERNAVDYLLKPVNSKRLAATCTKLQQRLCSQSHDPVQELPDVKLLLRQMQQLSKHAIPDYLNWIKAHRGKEIHVLATADILYLKVEDKYISVYIKNTEEQLEEYLLRSSLKDLLQQLDPQQFWQIHRSIVVNVAAIDKVTKELTGAMLVHIGTVKLPVSRTLQRQFKTLKT
ncbi:MAG: LytTR family DNA-binding domain-containing protein [Gammaproteobacteria bacterium]|nr:LytTR family DNA-binding domain-containing protein [Gammaproteobacteria bacterium]